MGVPVSTRRYTSCSPPYPRGYFLCPSGWRKDKTHKQNSYNFGVGGLLSQIFKPLCLFLQKDNIRRADLVKIVRENISF